MDRRDDLPRIPVHLGAVDERTSDRERFAMGLFDDHDVLVRLDSGIGFGDAWPHHVRTVGDERDRAGVDGDDARLGRVGVRAAHREKGVVVEIDHERLAVDEDEVTIAFGELDALVGVTSEIDAEPIGERPLDLVDRVASEVVSGSDLHTLPCRPAGINRAPATRTQLGYDSVPTRRGKCAGVEDDRMWGSRRTRESKTVTCIACGGSVRRSEAREYDKHGDRWERTGKEFEHLCKDCYRDLCHQPRDDLEALLVEIHAIEGTASQTAFLRRYDEIVEERYGPLEERER